MMSSCIQKYPENDSIWKKNTSKGVLNTDWGDCGHVNFISGSYHGMILGASLSWNINSYGSDSEFDAAVQYGMEG